MYKVHYGLYKCTNKMLFDLRVVFFMPLASALLHVKKKNKKTNKCYRMRNCKIEFLFKETIMYFDTS